MSFTLLFYSDELKSLKVTSKKTSLQLNWLRSEWPCVEETKVELCPIKDESECTEAKSVNKEDGVVQVNIVDLTPCTQYKVS